MIKCQACATENTDNSQYCDECGSALGNIQNKADNAEVNSFQTQVSDQPIFQSASVTSVGIPPVIEEQKEQGHITEQANEERQLGAHAMLVIDRGDAIGTEFVLSSEESYIGRWDADNGVFPDVDLDAYDSEAKVSRRHSRITLAGKRYAIEDLGSTNGTYVNRGRRLIPGTAHVLNDGDEVIVGKIFLRFSINN